MARREQQPVGGGPKKVLYTLQTISRMGVGKAAKALLSKNACKACAYGMGGQRGGMTNELGEFPSVCNKSVQAQSGDILPSIPAEIFAHPIADLQELSGREMERLGRLDTPLFKAAGSDRFVPVEWDFALATAVQRLKTTDPRRSFFYSSGRSSNEAGFVFQLLARAYGTNNVNNCSYYCHQATSEGLATTVGKGTATIEIEDLTGADLIFVIGANPSSNHPRFIHMLKKCRERGGAVIVINPAKEPGLVKFAVPKSPMSMLKGGSEIASDYLQPRIGSDIALMKGIAKAVIEAGATDRAFIESHTAAFDAFRADIEALSWEQIVEACGVPKARIEAVAAVYARSERVVFAWGMGMTHHIHGVANVEMIANLALLRGMIGKRFAGLLPLRGHSNVQGIGTIGVKPVLAKDVLARMEETLGLRFPEEKGLDTMASLKAAERGEIDAAVIMGGNLWGATPDTAFATRAMGRIGFKLFLTTSLNLGHVNGLGDGEVLILPVTARDEEWEPTTQESMFNYVRLSDGGIRRLDNVRPESRILCQIGARLLPDSPIPFEGLAHHAKIREAIAAVVPGMEQLKDIEVAKQEFHVKNRLMHTPEFGTPDKRGHFVVTPTPTPERSRLSLATVRSEGQFNTIVYEEEDSYRAKAGRDAVFLARDDMAAFGVSEGQVVTLASDTGRMRAVVTPFDLPRGSAMAYYPEANVLVGTAVDPRSKTPAFKSVPVWIEA
ncbi:FdhF/YdeP family oxidoreductase [Kaistia dalseonensis]|uniref:Molybdopterin-dependent oxidoreductase alpha subunit n=1 Tax=Kaistia dalseonensis TaxID=410840 RepID=A0ABU0H9L2_9HYPH|nr:FdhF/YdeP family oxidoreductase [Kaistia dalseonensis]MCX5496391.1 FdhF/YdeP family oxidoreductase [Kaistia dalseonensis]MDQ0439012.1 molybdopterin-dependent oxidoreductase alpha subunit [Kaistia dalseonensis]